MGILIIAVYANPSLVLDPAGRLAGEAVDALLNKMGAVLAETAVQIPDYVGNVTAWTGEWIEKKFPNVPHMIQLSMSYLGAFLFIMLFLFVVPFTRFIPKKIFHIIFCSIFRKKR